MPGIPPEPQSLCLVVPFPLPPHRGPRAETHRTRRMRRRDWPHQSTGALPRPDAGTIQCAPRHPPCWPVCVTPYLPLAVILLRLGQCPDPRFGCTFPSAVINRPCVRTACGGLQHGSACTVSVLLPPCVRQCGFCASRLLGPRGEGWCLPRSLSSSSSVAVLASGFCRDWQIHMSHLLTVSQALHSQALRCHQLPFIPFMENHSTSDWQMRAVLDQAGGWPVTLEESSRLVWWPPGGARAGRGGHGQRAAPSVAVLCAGSRAVLPSLRSGRPRAWRANEFPDAQYPPPPKKQ